MRRLNRVLSLIDNLSDWVGKGVSFLMILLALVVGYDVVLRYVFNRPTIWAYETATMLFGAFVILGGAFVLHQKAHVNMDIIYSRLSVRGKAIIDVITFPLFFLFCGVLLWQGWDTAWQSVKFTEHSASVWAPPIYPFKLLLPVGAFLILLQGFSNFVRDIITASTGRAT